MAKGRKIEGTAEVAAIGNTCNGVAWETSYAVFAIAGESFRWISPKVDWLELREGQTVNLCAFVRDNNRLYSVKVGA